MVEVYEVKNKKWGIGSIALFLSLFATSFSYTYLSEYSIGEEILHQLHVNIPTALISTVLYFIAIYIGMKFKEDYGAKSGKMISSIFLIIILLQIFISTKL